MPRNRSCGGFHPEKDRATPVPSAEYVSGFVRGGNAPGTPRRASFDTATRKRGAFELCVRADSNTVPAHKVDASQGLRTSRSKTVINLPAPLLDCDGAPNQRNYPEAKRGKRGRKRFGKKQELGAPVPFAPLGGGASGPGARSVSGRTE